MSENDYFPFGSPDPTSSQLEEIDRVAVDALVSCDDSENEYFPFHSPDPTPSQLATLENLEDALTASSSAQQRGEGGGQEQPIWLQPNHDPSSGDSEEEPMVRIVVLFSVPFSLHDHYYCLL